jgi:hypothetical protein
MNWQSMLDWQKCCLVWQGDAKPCETSCLHCAKMAEVIETERARCIDILNAARMGRIDGDLRCLISRINNPATNDDMD